MIKPNNTFKINDNHISDENPAYFIADIAANHDGDLARAKDLIFLAKEAGANAAKFQHFHAETIVSDRGFKFLGDKRSHQSKWKKSVYDIYKSASLCLGWTKVLKETCDKACIDFFTSPYDFDLIDHIDPYVPAYKIGSGDITWIDIIRYIASKGKPYILATGASSFADVIRATTAGLEINPNLALLQCNTNYTGSIENMKHVQLNVLKSYRAMFPSLVLGLSDHTPGHSSVLGAVTLGARIIEKHFTDNTNRSGPDHEFSMNPSSWREMVQRVRELEAALGNGIKKIEDNEFETVILQRRAVRTSKSLKPGHIIEQKDLCVLRPCPAGAVLPYQLNSLLGRTLRVKKEKEDHLMPCDFE